MSAHIPAPGDDGDELMELLFCDSSEVLADSGFYIGGRILIHFGYLTEGESVHSHP